MSVLAHNNPFYSSKFGIGWAEDHITEFERENLAFLSQPDNCTIITELDADGTHNLNKFKMTKPMPRSLSGHAIDVVYNLRAALDQAIYSVATLNKTLTLSGFPSFTIRDDLSAFEKSFHGVTGKFIPQEISDLVRAFKPYKGGNNLIWALNKLCGNNKHGFLRPHPIRLGSGFVRGSVKGIGPEIPLHPEWDCAKNEMVLLRAPVEAKFDMKYDLDVFIAFGNIELIDGQPVVPTLHKFLGEVNSIVMAIEAETIRIGLI
jgi:hypothetical protein